MAMSAPMITITGICSAFIFPARVSGRGYKIGPVCVYVCVYVCLLFIALTAEPLDLQT